MKCVVKSLKHHKCSQPHQIFPLWAAESGNPHRGMVYSISFYKGVIKGIKIYLRIISRLVLFGLRN